LPRDEHSSLFRPLVKYGRKKDFNVVTSAEAVVVKDLKSVLLQKSFFLFFSFLLLSKNIENFGNIFAQSSPSHFSKVWQQMILIDFCLY
jgi:hypothetical protein